MDETKVHDFFVESGAFSVEIGENCRDTRLSKTIQVEGTTLLSFTITETTTIGQLMKHPKGAAFIRQMLGKSNGPSDAEQAEAMGEGSEKMMQNMMFEMPLGSLVSYGRMTSKQLKGLIASLNIHD